MDYGQIKAVALALSVTLPGITWSTATSQSPVADTAVTHATPANTLVVFTSHYSPPSERFRAGAAPSLEEKGWHIEYILTDAVDPPTFMYGAESWTGYTDDGSFYARLRRAF